MRTLGSKFDKRCIVKATVKTRFFDYIADTSDNGRSNWTHEDLVRVRTFSVPIPLWSLR